MKRASALLLLLVPLLGCADTQTRSELIAKPEIIESTVRYRRERVVAPGDRFDVVVRNHEDVSRACLVRPDGFISLPLLDEVKVAGLSFREVDELLTERLSKRLLDPEVTVIATDVRPDEVFVVGEVGASQVIPLRKAVTAAQAIILAGGFAESANRDKVSVIRLGEDGRLRAIIIQRTLKGQPARMMALQNFRLRADDLVFVPRSNISQFGLFMRQYVNEPLSGVNSVLATITNYRLIQQLDTSN